jgi:hypothetical protein
MILLLIISSQFNSCRGDKIAQRTCYLVVPEKLCKARDDGDVKAKARL